MRFELIKGIKSLEGTCYFEIVKNSDKNKPCWNENAFYLEAGVFNYFIKVFAKSSDRFDYFNFCKFNQFELKKLSKNLDTFIKTLDSIQTQQEYKSFFENDYLHMFPTDKMENNWKEEAKNLTFIAHELKEFTNECLENREVLWVLGL